MVPGQGSSTGSDDLGIFLRRVDRRHSERWNEQLFQPAGLSRALSLEYRSMLTDADYEFRIQPRRQPAARRTVGSSGGDRSGAEWIHQRNGTATGASGHVGSAGVNAGDDSGGRTAAVEQRGTTDRVLPDECEPDGICCTAVAHLNERRWVHEEDDGSSAVSDRLLRWEHHRAADVPAERCTTVRAGGDHDHCVHGSVCVDPAVHRLVVPPGESEQGTDPGESGLCATGEPRVSDHGTGPCCQT